MNDEQFFLFNEYLPARQPRLVRGPTGIGKSAAIRRFAAESAARALIRIDLSTKDPPDIEGMPFIKDSKTHYAAPYWWPSSRHLAPIMLLEELDRCSEAMQPVMMGLVLDGVAGENKLPDETIIFATANGSQYLTNNLDQALVRRFVVIDYEPTVDEWLAWGKSERIDQDIVRFIEAHRDLLDTPRECIGRPNAQIPCRSTWTDLARWLWSIPAHKRAVFLNDIEVYGESFVGRVAAAELGMWMATNSIGLVAEKIFDGIATPDKYTPIQIAHAASRVAAQFMKREPSEQRRALGFFTAAGKEQMAAFMARLPSGASNIFETLPAAAVLADSIVAGIL